jgi:hypothetical protein
MTPRSSQTWYTTGTSVGLRAGSLTPPPHRACCSSVGCIVQAAQTESQLAIHSCDTSAALIICARSQLPLPTASNPPNTSHTQPKPTAAPLTPHPLHADPLLMDLQMRWALFTMRLAHLLHESHHFRNRAYMSVLHCGMHPALQPGRDAMRAVAKAAGYQDMQEHYMGLALLLATSASLALVLMVMHLVSRGNQRRSTRGMRV